MTNEDIIVENGYNGNPLVPKANRKIEWTKYNILEFEKCMRDPVYFIETYGKIVSVDHGLVPFKLYDYQKEILAAYPDNRNILLNQSRQSGKTSIVTAIILHFAIFNESKTIAILANKGSQAMEIMSRIQLAFEYLPSWLKPGVTSWNKGSFELENGTKLIAAASSSSAIRGRSISLLYLDEFAFIPNWEEFAASVLPTVSSGKSSRIIASSTPNGLNHFYVYCEQAKQGNNGFWYKEVPWNDVPGRDEAWKEKTLKDINHDQEKFNAEYCCQFLGSSGTLIAGWKLKTLFAQQPLHSSSGLKQYERPEKNHVYVITVDVSRGKGLDYSAFQVIDVTEMPYKQVAVYRNNMITPVDYAFVVHKVAKTYNDAMVLVEVNDIGSQVSELLHFDYEYENVIFTESAGRAGKRVSGGFGNNADAGLRTTKTTKLQGCSNLKLLIEGEQLIINDKDTIAELSRFSKKGASYEAEPGCNDDLVMGLVIFAWLSTQQYFSEMTDINTLHKLRDRSDEDLMEELLPFGFVNNGVDDYENSAADFWKDTRSRQSIPREELLDDLFGDGNTIEVK